jgi:hypothetical protein
VEDKTQAVFEGEQQIRLQLPTLYMNALKQSAD